MALDDNGTTDNIQSDSAGTSATAANESPAIAATSSESVPSSVEAAAPTGPSSDATQPGADTRSLTPPNTTLQAANPAAQAPQAQDDAAYRQRYADLRREQAKWQQERQQFQSQLQQFQGVDPNQVRAFREQQARAEKENLPPWNRQHPANARFNEAKVKWTQFRQAIARAETPEQKQWIQQTLGNQFSNEDLNAVQAWEQHQRQFQETFAQDPEGSIADIVDRRVQQAIQQHTATAAATQTVNGWFEDPQNKPLIERYRGDMVQFLQGGGSWQAAQKFVQALARADGLQSRVGEADKAMATANEQSRLLKGNAAVTRDPKSQTTVDPMVIAKERNIQPGSSDYWDLLTELHSKNLLAKQ